jgi:hypothetical protein
MTTDLDILKRYSMTKTKVADAMGKAPEKRTDIEKACLAELTALWEAESRTGTKN